PVDDAMCIAVLDKAIKQKNETIEGYVKAGKADRADEEKKTLELYKQYMPAQMSEDEVVAEIAKAIDATGACEQKDMGKVMKILTPIIKGRFDGKAASQLVIKALLAKAGH
ncbi:MAG: GatB/YqeY domain-containing protein, partial [Prevotella sp.]|nr:GatB/YqeY domain-containing protein [Prevotella sp.]